MLVNLLSALLLAAANPAPPATMPDADMIVQARRRQVARDFVTAMTGSNGFRQLARWDVDVCPVISGIDPPQARDLAARIGAIAGTLHLVVRDHGCSTTLLIVFTDAASSVASALATQLRYAFPGQARAAIGKFAASRGPVRWVSINNPCGLSGCALQKLATEERRAPHVSDYGGCRRWGPDPRFHPCGGRLAFVAFADPADGTSWPATSIMAMFDHHGDAASHPCLTDDDRSYLQGLYGTAPDGLGEAQRSSIATRMRRDRSQQK